MPRRANSARVAKSSSRKVKVTAPTTGKGAYKKSRPVTGKGAYRGPIERLGRTLGTKFGRWVGSMTGTGDYVAPDGSLVIAPDPPRMVAEKDGVIITHREYLGDLISSSSANTFKIQSFGLNPGDPVTFPWLSRVCQENFQQYRFEQLMFEFRSFSADALNSTNTALGAVFACVNYDYSDADLNSRISVENTDWARSAKPSESFLVPIECDPKQTGLNSGLLYVLNQAIVPSNADPKTYYLGKMFIGSTGAQGTNVNFGSIYVSYRVKLYKPLMTRPLSSALIFTEARNTVDASNAFGTTVFSASRNCDTIGVTISGNVLTMKRDRLVVGQRFMLNCSWTGSSAGAITAPSITHSGASGVNYFSGYGLPYFWAPANGETCTKMSLVNTFEILSTSADVTITLGGAMAYPGGTNSVQVQIIQINGTPLDQIGSVDNTA